MNKLLLILPLVAVVAVAAVTQPNAAQPAAGDAAAAADPAAMTLGEIRKVDKEAKKVTIRHGEITSLDMPPMTMVFQVKDASWLDKFKAGDRVRFSAEKTDAGGFIVTDIRSNP